MRDKLHRRYQVHKEVFREGHFEGEIPLQELKRLAEMLYPDKTNLHSGDIKLKFEFVRSEYDTAMIVGHLDTRIAVECQRCLGAMEMPIAQDFRLLIDASDELIRESSLDSLYSDDGYIDVVEVVEDEMILGIPLVALHEDESCNQHWQVSESDSEVAVIENPFSVLKQLKTTDY